MTIRWQDADYDEVYRATGLDEFAKTGLGSFSAANLRTSEDGTHVIYVALFSLDPENFVYHWNKSTEGRPFEILEMFVLKREPSK
jgi:hypothetical protein